MLAFACYLPVLRSCTCRRDHRPRPITFPLAYLEHGALRGGPGEEPVQKKYYVNAQWQPPPERISTDKSFAFRLSFYLTDVSLREGANGPAKSVAKGEVLENGQPVRFEDLRMLTFGTTYRPNSPPASRQ